MSDKRDALIAEQQLLIREQKKELIAWRKSGENIRTIIYCVGGPLNDNKLNYTREQMGDFQKIVDELS